jgi:hypothetical protein
MQYKIGLHMCRIDAVIQSGCSEVIDLRREILGLDLMPG